MPAPPVDEAAAAEQAARDRRRRAQGETIATSYRGVGSTTAGPKKLIGE